MIQSNSKLEIDQTVIETIEKREKRSKRIALMVLFVCWGFAFFLALYPTYSLIGFVVLIAFSFFSLELFRFLPEKAEFKDPVLLTESEYNTVKEEYRVVGNSYQKYKKIYILLVSLFGLLIPIVAGGIYFLTGNKVVMSILLAMALFIVGAVFFLWIQQIERLDTLREITMNYKLKDSETD